ncbi:aminotransferase class I/II-fold pyridoxal phosphate-dependent enzyme [Thermoflavimicrobium dichotomicum]|uniref:Arginine/lysine/ornithine decarboxylase n=1 Tax=Thermoflavimicrobium dichotomicum TaxID=46223 RepID=A0A1I3QNS0_9BACL|nr:aminotransferase class I/II-fold pyridoxal phosphate-dependent enzyme [Thermoflavimicrobium dichotomicum]SFJ34911.1 Arginine/lysine/ornithine decarboxylase [Thermoflavimicrobium dichotomicum]
MNKQERAPLFEALLNHKQCAKGNFHVPGHKQGRVFDKQGKDYFHPILQLDLTEVGELDDLHDPSGVIAEAQRLAADLFGADETFFLIGGTTAGNIATILSLCQPDDEIIVQRSCHQSIFHGCLLAGVKPVCLRGKLNSKNGLEEPIQPAELEKALRDYPEAKAVIVTSPSYFGVVQPLQELKQVCDQYNVPLVVDEAHGAHFTFHPDLPMSAMESGADIAIQSTHKMLSSMTMSSMLHLKGNRVKKEELARWLRVIESSSPSYPLMASLDLARRDMALHGRVYLEQTWNDINDLRKQLLSLHHLEEVKRSGEYDPFKLVLRSRKRITGYQMADWLADQGIFVELADHEKILLCFSYGNQKEDFHYLSVKLKELDQAISSFRTIPFESWPEFPEVHTLTSSFYQLKKGTRVLISLSEAVGKISTDMVVPYPPGIPIVLPGEVFTKEVVDYLLHLVSLGGKIRGVFQSFAPQVYVLELNNMSK